MNRMVSRGEPLFSVKAEARNPMPSGMKNTDMAPKGMPV